MALPPDSKLQQLLLSSAELSSASLATRIVVSRLRIEISNNNALLGAKLQELKDFVSANDYAASDLASL
ncbi:hypothetical protein [Pseudoprimorskyibacter insulae]|uniref:Uncharacterized protein n=1 Tax=Pseudoprimorskyibacter insulae TaxID=1695997 RepID=A0A2R8AZ10_9RHOB|nr:hypothetical protein [Pseudoprimorskyibacter insulae]SPF81250.1 hypothetical protein PRI8871_03072 [Pseudoprimorskyibacter insulae]